MQSDFLVSQQIELKFSNNTKNNEFVATPLAIVERRKKHQKRINWIAVNETCWRASIQWNIETLRGRILNLSDKFGMNREQKPHNEKKNIAQ